LRELGMRELDDSTLWRISAYERMCEERGTSSFAAFGSSTVLSTTLVAELDQLRHASVASELLEIVAACVRQRESALLLLRHRGLVWPLTLFPRNDLYHLRRSIIDSLAEDNRDLELISVEPPGLRPPGHSMHERIGDPASYLPLQPLLWALALHVPRASLLRDVAGRAAYRLAPDFVPAAARLGGALGQALRRLRTEIAPLQDIARWPGMDRERATRLLNGVYLQGGLMMLRTHPLAREAEGPAARWREWLRRSR
jgi:hypothetical protein